MINKDYKYLPKEGRKKILLICDDIRVHSGVATVAQQIVKKTCQHFNWVQIAGAINHPDKGKKLSLDKQLSEETGIEDPSVTLYPVHGYSDSTLVRQLIKYEKPDAIMLFTDPRYFSWLFAIENEIRKNIPIIYLNIWDDYPAPLYNKEFYESCDLLMGISKQTVNINKIVLGDKAADKIIEYLPHGLDHTNYKPASEYNEEENKDLEKMKEHFFGKDEIDFCLFFNSRNIRRKQIPDTLWAFRMFLDSLPQEKADKCRFLLHTELVTDAGTDLKAVAELLFGDGKYPKAVIFDQKRWEIQQLRHLYNITDCQILLTSNEGWGLTLTEGILSGNPIIANCTGGMQDQMRFADNKGKWFTPTPEIPSNNTGKYKNHGEWAFPVYPTSRSIQGSPQTPYIWDDRCEAKDAADRIREVYDLGPKKRKELGLKGREWAISDEAGFTAEHQGKRFIDLTEKLFNTWEPRETFEVIDTDEADILRTQTHNLVY
jgi:hypothetical protein|tara:strand:+ start:901 stop:2361 length:1461 start_codon:yes stop_codon:yes gene_type:complete